MHAYKQVYPEPQQQFPMPDQRESDLLVAFTRRRLRQSRPSPARHAPAHTGRQPDPFYTAPQNVVNYQQSLPPWQNIHSVQGSHARECDHCHRKAARRCYGVNQFTVLSASAHHQACANKKGDQPIGQSPTLVTPAPPCAGFAFVGWRRVRAAPSPLRNFVISSTGTCSATESAVRSTTN